MKRKNFFALFVLFTFSVFRLPSYAGELRVSPGMANYQFEGAGSSPNLLWESKPTYPSEPYLELEWSQIRLANSLYGYNRAELEYLGGHFVDEKSQPVSRKVNTWLSYFAWGWRTKYGFGFETGPMAVFQSHRVYELYKSDGLTRNIFRAGSFFAAFYEKPVGAWNFKILSSIGILGLPQRQSSISEVEGEAVYQLRDSPWSVGMKYKTSLIQLLRDQSRIENIAGTPGVISLFRQNETDTKILMFSIRRRL